MTLAALYANVRSLDRKKYYSVLIINTSKYVLLNKEEQ